MGILKWIKDRFLSKLKPSNRPAIQPSMQKKKEKHYRRPHRGPDNKRMRTEIEQLERLAMRWSKGIGYCVN